MSPHRSLAFAITLTLSCIAGAAHAQDVPDRLYFSGSAELWGGGGSDALLGIAIRGTRLRRDGPGFEVAVATFPDALANGPAVFVADAAILFGAVRSGGALVFKIGPSVILAAADGGGTALAGAFVGGGAMVHRTGPVGVRFDVGARFFGGMPVLAAGVGISVSSRQSRSAHVVPGAPPGSATGWN